jgi:hypothetical protein
MSKTLTITHNAGIFSCYSIRLQEIIKYFNDNKCLPEIVDSSQQFALYKNTNIDLSKILFDESDISIDFNDIISISKTNDEVQFSNFDLLNFEYINLFIDKYFKPTQAINFITDRFVEKYLIVFEETCSVFYRGNDKITETNIPDYDVFFDKCKKIKEDNQNIRFLVQTDEYEFYEEFSKIFTNSTRIDEIPMIRKQNSVVHQQIPRSELTQFAMNFLAATLIVSKCNFLVTNSGNCGYWSVLFRGNSKNVYQYLTTGRNIEFNPNLVEYNYWSK